MRAGSGDLRIGMIGAGKMAAVHSIALTNVAQLYPDLALRPRLTAVADVNPTLATGLAERFGYERVETDWRSLVAAGDIDLVVICLPPVFNREVIGWSMADHLRTELVTDALDMAVRNHRLEPDCIMHSDRGTQYTSAEYRATLTRLGLRHSVGRTGQCWDNALAESFFASLKNERVHHIVYPSRKKAKEDIARYIELFYNQRRIHSALGYRTPREVRTEYLNSQLAA